MMSLEDGEKDESSIQQATPPSDSATTEKAPQESSNPEPPKEDLQAWLRVLGAWMLYVAAWGTPQAYGAFELYYKSTLLPQYSDSALAWIGSMNSFLLICSGVLAGPFFDRGYLKSILALGCFMMVFGLMMLSLSTKYYQVFLAQGACFSLGSGLVYVPAISFVTSSFTKYRAYAVGVTTTGASVGGVIYPIMFLKLVPEVGFPWTCRIFGFVNLALSIGGLALVWSAPTKTTKPRSLTQLSAFLEPAYLTLALAFFLQFLGYWIPIFYIPSFATVTLGASADLGIYAAVIFNAAGALGRLAPTILIAKFGATNVVFAATLATMIMFFCWIAIKSFAGLVVWCVFLGFSSGVFISGNPIIAAHPRISSLSVLGTRLGQLWFCAGTGALIGTPIAGALTNPSSDSYLKTQIFSGCIMAGTCLAFLYPLWDLNRYDRDARKKQRS